MHGLRTENLTERRKIFNNGRDRNIPDRRMSRRCQGESFCVLCNKCLEIGLDIMLGIEAADRIYHFVRSIHNAE